MRSFSFPACFRDESHHHHRPILNLQTVQQGLVTQGKPMSSSHELDLSLAEKIIASFIEPKLNLMKKNTAGQDNANQHLVISYLALRRGVGIIGMALPVILVVGMLFVKTCNTIQPSISDYYYTKLGNLLVGSLCIVGMFLFSYRGYEKKDMIAGKLASLFSLCIAFFPTGGPDASSACNFLHRNSESWISTIHDISAGSFFLVLAYFCLFLFTIRSAHPTRRKLMRNRIYKCCGYTILLCILLLLVYFNVRSLRTALKDYHPIFVLETIALWAFGFSWLTKGEAILKDK